MQYNEVPVNRIHDTNNNDLNGNNMLPNNNVNVINSLDRVNLNNNV
jgi:hypothetical protein